MSEARRLLIIDDSPTIGRIYELILAEAGYDARHIADPADLANAVTEGRPAALIVDNNGVERWVHKVREVVSDPSVPIVGVLSPSEPEDALSNGSIPVAATLRKPVESDQLLAAVRAALGEKTPGQKSGVSAWFKKILGID